MIFLLNKHLQPASVFEEVEALGFSKSGLTS